MSASFEERFIDMEEVEFKAGLSLIYLYFNERCKALEVPCSLAFVEDFEQDSDRARISRTDGQAIEVTSALF